MKRYLLILMCVSAFLSVNAQTGGLVYYLKDNGKLVSTKDSADYSMVVLPPDTSVDRTLYTVYQYYKSGKIMLATGSKTNDINLQYQGRYVAYFENGHRMKIGTWNNGSPVGLETEYYPNGKLFHIKNYVAEGQSASDTDKVYLKECRDSTGTVLAENGNGKWIEYDSKFKNIKEEGPVLNGNRDSLWIIFSNGVLMNRHIYKNGDILPSLNINKFGNKLNSLKITPEFSGGNEGFANFLSKNIHYPKVAKENGTQGKVIVSFIVEADGTVTDVRAVRGIGDGCDEESIRVILLMPKWKPGIRDDGKPTRVAYSVPIVFSLTENHK